VAKRKIVPDPQGSAKRELTRLIDNLMSMTSRLILCYHGALMRPIEGELEGWVRYNEDWLANKEWALHDASYLYASHLARNIGRLVGQLALGVETRTLGDLVALLETTDAPRLQDMTIRDQDEESRSAHFDTRHEPVRGLLLALRGAQFNLDVLQARLGGHQRAHSQLLRERASLARSIRTSHRDRPWSRILDEVQEIYPDSLGLPPLTESNLRASMSRSAARESIHKSKPGQEK
jgi:hypothetical protein